MKYTISIAAVHAASVQQLKDNWAWYLILGIGLVGAGFLALVYSVMSTVFSVLLLGFLFIALGIFEGIKSLKIHLWGSFFLHLILTVLYIVCGSLMIMHPISNAVSLTLLMAIFFVISGLLKIFFAVTHNVPHAGWLIFNGLITTLLGIVIWQQWPSSGFWVIGMIVGIDAMFTGWTWILLALAAKNLPKNNTFFKAE